MNFKNPVNLVYVISFIDLFAVGLTFPLFSTHLQSLGASHTFIGVLSSIYSALQVFSGPLIGSWADVKDRLYVLKRVIFICSICYALLGFSHSFLVITVLRIVLGCTKHIQSICKAIITDILPNEKHSEAFGKSAAVSSFGFIVGPFIGGHISELDNGFKWVCLLTSFLFAINIVVISKLKLPEKKYKTNNKPNNVGPFMEQMKEELGKTLYELKAVNWHEQWESFLLRFLFGLAVSSYFSNQSLLLKEKYKLSQKHSGYVISYVSSIGACSAFFLDHINRLLRTRDNYTRLLLFFALLALSVIAIYISPNVIVFFIMLIPFSITSAALRVISMETILQKTDAQHRGSLSGACNSLMSVSRFVTPLVTGIIGDKFGEGSVILVAVVPALAGTFLSWHLKKTSSKMARS